MGVTLASPRGTLPPHDLNAARAPGPPHLLTAHPGPHGWSGDGSSDAEDHRPRSRTLRGEGADREEETRALGIGGRGPAPGWVLLGKGCGLNATARRTQGLHALEARSGAPPHSTSSARTVGPCPAAVTQSPAPSSRRGHSWRDTWREAQGSSSPRPGRRPVSPAPAHTACRLGRWPLTFLTQKEAWTVFKAAAMFSINSGEYPGTP